MTCPCSTGRVGWSLKWRKAPRTRTSVPFSVQTRFHGAPVESGSREVKVRFRPTVLFKWRTKQNKTCLSLARGQMSKKLITEGEGPKDIIDKGKKKQKTKKSEMREQKIYYH